MFWQIEIYRPQGVEYRCPSIQKEGGLAAEPLWPQEYHQLYAPGKPEVELQQFLEHNSTRWRLVIQGKENEKITHQQLQLTCSSTSKKDAHEAITCPKEAAAIGSSET